MAFNKIFKRKSTKDSKTSGESIGEPYDFQRNVSVKIDTETNRLVGLPQEWLDIFKKNNIDTTLDANQLKPIFKAYERSVQRKGIFC